MPNCPKHGEMIHCFSGVETVGIGWDRHQAYYEDFICPQCKFRVRLHYRVIDIGR